MKSFTRLKRGLLLVLYCFFVFALSAQEFSPHYVKGVVRVKVSKEAAIKLQSSSRQSSLLYEAGEVNPKQTGVEAFNSLNVMYRASEFKRVFRKAGKFESRRQQYGLDRWYEIVVDSTISHDELVSVYGQLEVVEVAEAKVVYRKHAVDNDGSNRTMTDKPNDPLYHNQYHYENIGQTEGKVGADINLRKAWGIETGSPEVTVAIIDGGIDIEHEDLKAILRIIGDGLY